MWNHVGISTLDKSMYIFIKPQDIGNATEIDLKQLKQLGPYVH